MWSTLNGVAGKGLGLAKGILDAATDEFRENGQAKEKVSPRQDVRWTKSSTRRKDVHSNASEFVGNGINTTSSSSSDPIVRRRSADVSVHPARFDGTQPWHGDIDRQGAMGKNPQASNGHHGGWLSSAGQYLETINHIVVGTPADEEMQKLRTQLQRLKTELLEVNVAQEENQRVIADYEQRINHLASENTRLTSQLDAAGSNEQVEAGSDEMHRLQMKLKKVEGLLSERTQLIDNLQGALERETEATSSVDPDGNAQKYVLELEAAAAVTKSELDNTTQQLGAVQKQLEAVQQQLAAVQKDNTSAQAELQRARRDAQEAQARGMAASSEAQRLKQLLAEREEQVEGLMEQLSSGHSGEDSLAGQLKHEHEQHQLTRAELEQALRSVAQAKEEADTANQALSERDAFWIKELDTERAASSQKFAQVEAQLKEALEAAAVPSVDPTDSLQYQELLGKFNQLEASKQQAAGELAALRQQLSEEQQKSRQLQQRVDALGCLVGSNTDDPVVAKLQEQLQQQNQSLQHASKQQDEVERRYRALLSQAEDEHEQLRQWLDEETHTHLATQAKVSDLEQQLALAATSATHAAEQSEQLSVAESRVMLAEARVAELEMELAAAGQRAQELEEQLENVGQQLQEASDESTRLRAELDCAASRQLQEGALRQQLQESQAEAAQKLQLAEAARDEAQEKLQRFMSSQSETVQQLQHKLQEADAARQELQGRVHKLEQLLESEQKEAAEKQEQYRRQLSDAQQARASLDVELERLQERLVHERSSHAAALQERDAFWQGEVSGQAAAHAAWEQQLRQLHLEAARQQTALEKGQRELERAAEERERLKRELQARNSSCSELSTEVSSLQQQLERTSAAAALQLGQEVALEKELMDLRTTCARLQADSAQAQAQHKQLSAQREQMARDAERAAMQLEATRKERDQLYAEVESVRQRCALLEEQAGGAVALSAQGTHSRPLPELAELREQVLRAQGSERAAEAEKERLKAQLQRLKQQMLVEQEEEEEKSSWRVQQEVDAVTQCYQQSEAALRQQLDEVQSALTRLRSESDSWDALLAAKDAEVQNLQAVLGELAYETEAHERLRQELRASEMKIEALRAEVAEANDRANAAAAQQREASEATLAAERSATEWREAHSQLKSECRTLRHALEEAMKRVTLLSSDTNSLVDRRIVVKLLVTYFERGHSKDVLMLMARMLQLSPEEQRAIGLGDRAGSRGLLRSVAAAPFALVRSSLGLASNVGAALASPSARSTVSVADSLADQWVDFLLQQTDGRTGEAGPPWESGGDISRGSSVGGLGRLGRSPFLPPDFTNSHPSSPARSDIPASPDIRGLGSSEREQYYQPFNQDRSSHAAQPPLRPSIFPHPSNHVPNHPDPTAMPSHSLPPMPASNGSIASASSHISHSHAHHDWSHFSHSHSLQPAWSSAMGPPPPPLNPTSSHSNPGTFLGGAGMYRGHVAPVLNIGSNPQPPPQPGLSRQPSATPSDSAAPLPRSYSQRVSGTDSLPDNQTTSASSEPPQPPPQHPRYPRPNSYDSLHGLTPYAGPHHPTSSTQHPIPSMPNQYPIPSHVTSAIPNQYPVSSQPASSSHTASSAPSAPYATPTVPSRFSIPAPIHQQPLGASGAQPASSATIPWPTRLSIPSAPVTSSLPHRGASSSPPPAPPPAVMPSPTNLGAEFTTIDLHSSPTAPSKKR